MLNTRREFLTLMAAAVVPGVRQVERLQRRGSAQRVIVLGAGLAGLACAYELQNLGHTVSVLEAQMRPGGRVRTLRESFAPGLYTEAGAESIPGVHDVTLHYARELGLELVPTAVPGTRSVYHVRGQRIVPNEVAVWPFDLTVEERKLGLAGLFRKYVDAASQQALTAGFAQQGGPGAERVGSLHARRVAAFARRVIRRGRADHARLRHRIRLGGIVPPPWLECTGVDDELSHRRRE
jgi:phytoene dehydrogenase-like protein